MSDQTDAGVAGEPFDQTNGLVAGLDGDDGGAVDDDTDGLDSPSGLGDGRDGDGVAAAGGVLGAAFNGLANPDSAERGGLTESDTDEATTRYSEEGKP
ncbi:hypothetical protein [Herbiconiux daphne]|uniref:Chemotaxis protein n=1 Tax=Herbiconiux daphne TaxID=2970914 RepID=A0ABT2H4F0_9MICO|nr:hypothetical protein [Herbiconiux daphne]MCS5734793.1 hypothetical protein [Herbiconiux daphne]